MTSASLPRLVYIHAMGHSGSTILESLLGSHSRCVNVGEIRYLDRYVARDQSLPDEQYVCTCGAAIADCPFWQKVNEGLRSSSSRKLKSLSLAPSNTVEDAADDLALLRALGDAVDASVVVDSSKTFARLRKLLPVREIDLTVVILHAAPGKIVNSQSKAATRKNRKIPGVLRTLYHLNRFALTFFLTAAASVFNRRRLLIVRYEDMVRNPTGFLREFMPKLGLAFEPDQLNWAARERHSIGGNRTRLSKTSEIREDTKWKTDLSVPQRVLIAIGAASYSGVARVLGILTR